MVSELAGNKILIISVCAWALAQILKVLVLFFQERKIFWHYFFASGGMPSAHTATVCSLATSIAMMEGPGSIAFAISAVLAAIVMYDAAGVRQSVGKHSAIINLIIKELRTKTSKWEREKDLREVIGHTPFQVLMGALLGILTGWAGVFFTTL